MARTSSVGTWHHVMNRGARHLPIFGGDDDRRFFLRCVDEALQQVDARVHAYVLMGNHYHLLVEAPVSAMARTMKWVSESYTRRFNRNYGLDGSLFRGRYRSKAIDGERHLLAVLRYVHRNPVEDGFGGLDYEWSSHGAYAWEEPAPRWLTVSHLLGRFESRQAYRDFVAGPEPGCREGIDEHRPSIRTGTIDAVDRVLGIDSGAELFLVRERQVRSDLRAAAALLAMETTNRTSADIAERYGYRSGGAVRTAATRARARLVGDDAFAALVADARRRLRVLDQAA